MSTSCGARSRYEWIDVMKGISILLVVVGHLMIPQWLYKYIYSFHLYVFFFCAGITFRYKKDLGTAKYIQKCVRTLMFPYFLFAVLRSSMNIGSRLSHGGGVDVMMICDTICEIALGTGGGNVIGPAWFLLALLWTRIFFHILVAFQLRHITICVISVLVYVIGVYVGNNTLNLFKIMSASTCVIFYYLGYILKTLFASYDGKNCGVYFCVCAGVSLYLSSFEAFPLNLITNTIPATPVLNFACGLLGCLSVFYLSFLILKQSGALLKVVLLMGVNSLVVMGTHIEIKVVLSYILNRFFDPSYYMSLALLLCIIIFSVPICALYRKYVASLIGK